ncbi:MAG: dynein heavy chain, N-terminal region 1-domain-containing protein, partial [Olpidium bornovanus]
MRKEADDIGPNAELAHWKARMVKFNSITDQLKSPTCKKVIGILNAVKSRTLLKVWKDLDNRVTDAANESKDNVKYLYTLEKFCEPLYRSDPVGMIPAIPGLINAIKMIYSISRYYNTSERMTSLFDGDKIWSQERSVLVKKLEECVHLDEAYQKCFHETKRKLQETPNEKQFDFSEMYIFGKFDAFCKRIQKVTDMFSIIEKFSMLEELRIEGMDPIIKRFSNILTQMQRKPYDILDHRKMEYDSDYLTFKKQIQDLEANLQQFIDSSFERISSTEQSLTLLGKFSQIQGMQLDLESKYHTVFVHYTRRDLEGVRKLYEKHKATPPIPRNTPPVSGAIAWARQLYRRIEMPMKLFEDTSVLETAEAKRHVRNYNKIARALIEFEALWYRAWYSVVDQEKSGLQATLLVADNDGNFYVNFDPQIHQLIKEAKCMQVLGLSIPDSIQNVCAKEMDYKNLSIGLQHILQSKKRTVERLSPLLRKAIGPHIEKLDMTLAPGLTALTWTSLNLENYLAANNQQLGKLSELIDKVLDITEWRIEHGLKKIAELALCDLPSEPEQWTVEAFLEKTDKRCGSVIATISNRAKLVENATRDLLDELM